MNISEKKCKNNKQNEKVPKCPHNTDGTSNSVVKISVLAWRLGRGTHSVFPGGQKEYGNVCDAFASPHVLQ